MESKGKTVTHDDCILEYYKGFQLVAKFYQNRHQGCAWRPVSRTKLSVDGDGLPEVIARLRAAVDTDVQQNRDRYRADIEANHVKYLAELGKADPGRGPAHHFHRISHCYNCKTRVDNEFDLECLGCGWIICSYCASCGCGYRGFG